MATRVAVPSRSPAQLSREQLIKLFFRQGYPYGLILCFLYYVHGYTLSLRQLKRILRRFGLRRRVAITTSHLRCVEHAIRVRTNHFFLHDEAAVIWI